MAPTASTSSGRTGVSAVSGAMSFMRAASRSFSRYGSLPLQRGGFPGRQCVIVVVEQLRHRCRRHIEHGLRIDAEQDGEDDERHEDDGLADAQIHDAREARLLQGAENDLAVE